MPPATYSSCQPNGRLGQLLRGNIFSTLAENLYQCKALKKNWRDSTAQAAQSLRNIVVYIFLF